MFLKHSAPEGDALKLCNMAGCVQKHEYWILVRVYDLVVNTGRLSSRPLAVP